MTSGKHNNISGATVRDDDYNTTAVTPFPITPINQILLLHNRANSLCIQMLYRTILNQHYISMTKTDAYKTSRRRHNHVQIDF